LGAELTGGGVVSLVEVALDSARRLPVLVGGGFAVLLLLVHQVVLVHPSLLPQPPVVIVI